MITRSNLFLVLALTAITALFVAVLFSRGVSQSGATEAIPPVNKMSPTSQELTTLLTSLKEGYPYQRSVDLERIAHGSSNHPTEHKPEQSGDHG